MSVGFIRDVGISIVSASSAGFIFNHFKLPLILAYILAGIILGPHIGFGIITSNESINILAEIGLIFLMYILGMEIDLQKLLKAGKAVFINGITQFLGCSILGLLFFQLFGFKLTDQNFNLIYLAIAGSLSSTLIVVKILSDRVELDSLTSRITLGILVLQDIWAIAFLATQPNLNNFQFSIILLSLGKALLLILITWLLAKYLLPLIFKLSAKQSELTLIIAMGWCFTIAGIANVLGLSLEMGALIAGVSIASFPYHVQIAVKISSLRDFFITLFFVALGLQIPMPNNEIIFLSLGIVLFTLFSRVITVFPILYKLKYGNRGSLIPGLNLSQVSEFSLVILSLGINYGHIKKEILSSFIISLVITALLSSIIIPYNHQIYRWLNPILEKFGLKDHIEQNDKESNKESIKDEKKVIFLGFYREASSLFAELESRHGKSALDEILIIDINPETIRKLTNKNVAFAYGDIGHSDTLHHLNLENAEIIISSIPDSILRGTSNLKLLKSVKEVAPNAKIIVTAETINGAKELYSHGADYVYIPRIVSAHYLVDIIERIESGNSEIVKQNSQKFLEKRQEILE